jgi:hypothetical protein
LKVFTRSRSPPLSRSPRLVPANIPLKFPGGPPAAGCLRGGTRFSLGGAEPFRNLIPVLIACHRKQRQQSGHRRETTSHLILPLLSQSRPPPGSRISCSNHVRYSDSTRVEAMGRRPNVAGPAGAALIFASLL